MAASALFTASLLAGLQLAPAQIPDHVWARFNRKPPTHAPQSTGPGPNAPTGGAFKGGTAKGSTEKRTSKGACAAISFGYSEVKNQQAIAKSAADVTSYICGPGAANEGEAHAIATATAEAYATAVAEASVACGGEGDVSGYAKAHSHAVAAAQVWLGAYADATAASASGDCEKCNAYAQSWGYLEKEVFLKAVAGAKAIVDGYSVPGGSFIGKAHAYKKDVQSAIVTAYATAISSAKKYHDGQECFAWANTGGCIWTPDAADPEFCFQCEATSVGATAVHKIDAIAEASAAAASYTCGNDTTADAESYVAATALAHATAQAVSFAYASCKSDDGGYSCSTAYNAAEEAAYAVAVAFADAWAGGYNCEETCFVESENAVTAIGDILVKASTSALTTLCAAAGEKWTVEVLTESIEHASITAVAEAVAAAVVGGNECYAAAYTGAAAH